MRQAQTYKPSNTFSFVGFILMFVSMLLAGCLLSWLYVVLQAVIPIIYLCVLITIGFGADGRAATVTETTTEDGCVSGADTQPSFSFVYRFCRIYHFYTIPSYCTSGKY